MKFEDDELIQNDFGTMYFHFFSDSTQIQILKIDLRIGKSKLDCNVLGVSETVPVNDSMPKAHFTFRINNV